MRKDCARGNERLDAKSLTAYHVGEGEGCGSKIPPDLRAFYIARGNSSLYYVSNIPQKGLRNPRILAA